MRSNKQQVAGIGGSYAIETSFCGAKPLINPSTYDLSQHAQDEELGNQSPRWANVWFYQKKKIDYGVFMNLPLDNLNLHQITLPLEGNWI